MSHSSLVEISHGWSVAAEVPVEVGVDYVRVGEEKSLMDVNEIYYKTRQWLNNYCCGSLLVCNVHAAVSQETEM